MKIPELTWPHEPTHDYDEDLLLSITVARVALLIRGRNAWHSTWVKHYLQNATLYTDVPSAQAAAETQRGRGNVFYIVEAPAIQLRGAESNVLLCDSHPDNPFGAFTGLGTKPHSSNYGAWIAGLFPGVSMRDAVAAFAHNSGHWAGPTPSEASLRTGRLPQETSLPGERKQLESLVSAAVGVDYYLAWREYPVGAPYAWDGVDAVVGKWGQQLLAAGLSDSTTEPDPESLRRYRTDVLQALPRSEWEARRASEIRRVAAARVQARDAWLAQGLCVADMWLELSRAQIDLTDAQADRMHPSETAIGMRLQRERLEHAKALVSKLEKELVGAEELEDRLHANYLQLGS